MSRAFIILGDQLFDEVPGFDPTAPVFMREDWGLCSNDQHHKQKLVLFLSAMRTHSDDLRAKGHLVHYEKLAAGTGVSYLDALHVWLDRKKIKSIQMVEPADGFFLQDLAAWASLAKIDVQLLPSPAFMTSGEDWRRYRSQYKRLHMADFYSLQRKRLGIMVDHQGVPEGGQWSFDTENRRSLPRWIQPPPVKPLFRGHHVDEVSRLVAREFSSHPGEIEPFGWATSRQQARALLDDFVTNRLADFGPYEDAVSKDHSVLWHSQLSYLMNMGLLTPGEIIKQVLARPSIPLASREGFVRQVIGWREFLYHVDREYREGKQYQRNKLDHQRRLSSKWWTGSTGLQPIDHCIKKALNTGYLHHIERLMILGSSMLLCEVHPDDSYKWFMEMFIDSAEWVMRPNVYGMSQFADGGMFATKPYISGSAYLRKMTDFPPGPWCDEWDGLFWRFIYQNRERLGANQRMSMMVRQVEKMAPAKLEAHIRRADEVIARVTVSDGAAR